MLTCLGPYKNKFLAISDPNPLNPKIIIFNFDNFFIVSIPKVCICREYKVEFKFSISFY